MDTRFHCVYLLTSLDPECEGDYYIGYTVNPLRRLRQHNGELVNGARRTSRRGRPWTIVCCVSGFTEDRAALKFEWCWQNPTVSTRLKHTVGALKGLRRLPYAVGVLHFLVRAPLFNQLDLSLHIFEQALLCEARAKAEVFLAVRRGAKRIQRIAPPPQDDAAVTHSSRQLRSATEGDDAGAPLSPCTPLPSATSAYGSDSVPSLSLPLLLPPLEPSSLFHVEVLTRQAFEDAYLSHDRCLLLPSAGVATGGGDGNSGSFMGERGDEDSCLSASCPYDVSVLSQAARAEWSNASLDLDVTAASDADDDSTRRFGVINSRSPSRTPSPRNARARSGTPELPLDFRSGEPASPKNDERIGPPSSPPASHLCSRPLNSTLSPSLDRRAENEAGCSAASSPSRLRAPSSPASFEASTIAGAAHRPRIPLRFAHYSEADFASAHADEQHRLHHNGLPCSLCALPLRPPCVVHCSRAPFCELRCHLSCLAMWMLYAEELGRPAKSAVRMHTEKYHELRQQTQRLPSSSQTETPASLPAPVPFRRLIPSEPCPCPLCGVPLQWGVLMKELKKRVVVEERLQAAQRRKCIEQRWKARLAQMNGNRAAGGGPKRGYQRKKRLRREPRGSLSSTGEAATSGASPPSEVTALDASLLTPLPGACSPHHQSVSPPSSVAPPPTPSSQNAGETLLSSVVPAASGGSSLLSWTAFYEDDWLL
ncbi:hypothetical protein ABL78_3653 [Leptomonas seymouri]|uniref:Structure-specific endonuclease subunit SLX1 homolog n=1 Tax=Leptomonas seymouri TaxID=5684 RepID=A0A0N1I7G5_LEPSE|nr:hypothetical protein ABL78_3653 [Leptomonas seymouri]|eukprot:KPI87258.1 hypothetical protein ABL78_3653 [Leptomonas seymouri]